MRITSPISPISTLLLFFAGSQAHAALPNSVAIAVDTSSLGRKAADEIQDGAAAQILAGLAAANMNLAPASDEGVVTQAQNCESADCLQALAKSAQLDLVVQARVLGKKAARRGKLDYVVSMTVARPDRAPEAWREQTDCQSCDAGETKHMAFLLATLIGERVASEAQPAKPEPTVAQPPPPSPAKTMDCPEPAPAPKRQLPIAPPAAPPTTDDNWSMPRSASSAIFALGLVSIGAGIYALHIDGRGTCDLHSGQQACPNIHDTKALGTGLVMGGSVVALGGLASLIFFAPASSSSHLALSWTGSSLSFSGAF